MCKKPRARYQNSEPPNQRNRSRLASRSNCTHHKEIFPPQYHIYIDMLSIHVLRPYHTVQFSCNLQRCSTLGRCKIGKYTFPSQFPNMFLTYQTFVTNLHLLRVELRCKLPGILHRVTGPLAHHVVLNHTFELLISINKWNYKQM